MKLITQVFVRFVLKIALSDSLINTHLSLESDITDTIQDKRINSYVRLVYDKSYQKLGTTKLSAVKPLHKLLHKMLLHNSA